MDVLGQLKMLNRPFVAMATGLPGSGKSTQIRTIISDLDDCVVVSPDSIRKELSGCESDQSLNSLVWDTAHKRVSDALKNGNNVLFDATYAKINERARDIERYRDMGAKSVVCIYITTSFKEALLRNANRARVVPHHAMLRMQKYLEKNPPSIEDGFDQVIRIRN